MAFVRPSLVRDVATVSAATLLSRLLGFVRDLGIAAVLGAGAVSDAFFAAMLIPNLFRRLLTEGALNSAFVPAWIRTRAEDGAAGTRRLGEEAFGLMLVGLGSLALICAVLAPVLVRGVAPGFAAGDDRYALAVTYLRIALPYITIAGIVAVAAAALNAEGRVGAVSIGLVIYNGVVIAAVVLLLFGHMSLYAGVILSAAVVLAGLAQMLVIGTALIRLPVPPLHPRLLLSARTRRLFAMALPGLVAAGIPQLKLIAGAMVASPSPSAVSWLYYSYRLYELPLGVISVTVASVMAPAIAASLRANDIDVRGAQSRALEITLGLALPAALGIAVLAVPIAATLFEHGAFGPRDSAAVGSAIAAIAAGLPGHAIEKVFGSISFAHDDTRTPMLTALGGLAAAIGTAIALFPAYGHVGVAAAIAGSGWVGAGSLGIILARRRWLTVDRALTWRLPRIVLVAATMGLATYFARLLIVSTPDASSALQRSAELAILVIFGLAVYAAGLQALGVTQIRDLVAMVRGRG